MQNNFTQLCVWPGTVLGDSTPEEFTEAMAQMFNGVRIKYDTEVSTLPDLDEGGNPISETGGRNDLFFYVHSDDIGNFAVPRLKAGIRWWEDVVGYNDNRSLYTKDFINARPLNW